MANADDQACAENYGMAAVDAMTDYKNSLHFQISQNLHKQATILNQGFEGMTAYAEVESPIQFGKTKLSDYQQIAPLGKGTYGEVNKCYHIESNSIVAIKTFFFEVSVKYLSN